MGTSKHAVISKWCFLITGTRIPWSNRWLTVVKKESANYKLGQIWPLFIFVWPICTRLNVWGKTWRFYDSWKFHKIQISVSIYFFEEQSHTHSSMLVMAASALQQRNSVVETEKKVSNNYKSLKYLLFDLWQGENIPTLIQKVKKQTTQYGSKDIKNHLKGLPLCLSWRENNLSFKKKNARNGLKHKNKTVSTKTQEKQPKSHWSSVEVARASTMFYAQNWSIKENNQAFLPCLSCINDILGVTKEWKTRQAHTTCHLLWCKHTPLLMKNVCQKKLNLNLFKSLTLRNIEDRRNKIKDTRMQSESQNRSLQDTWLWSLRK